MTTPTLTVSTLATARCVIGANGTASEVEGVADAPARCVVPEREWAGRRVLVTGGSGFIGFRVVEGLCRGGAVVMSVDRLRPRWRSRLRCRIKECDIRSARLVELAREFAPHVVVHLAAQVDVSDSVRSPGMERM